MIEAETETDTEGLDLARTPLPPMSSKIRMLVNLIRDINARSNGKEKTIVFSHFLAMLDLVETFLTAEGIVSIRCERVPWSLNSVFINHLPTPR